MSAKLGLLKLVDGLDGADERACLEARLRFHFAQRDQLARQLAAVDRLIAEEAGRYARLDGLLIRPRLEQIRRIVGANQ